MAGLSWSAWLLLIASFGIGLSIAVRFYLRNRRKA